MAELNKYDMYDEDELAQKWARIVQLKDQIEQLRAEFRRELVEIAEDLGLNLGGPEDPSDAGKGIPA